MSNFIQKQFTGASQIAGGTFLDTQAYFTFKEGYLVGDTYEYSTIQNYQLETLNYSPFDERITITAISPLERIKKYNYLSNKVYEQKSRFDDFNYNVQPITGITTRSQTETTGIGADDADNFYIEVGSSNLFLPFNQIEPLENAILNLRMGSTYPSEWGVYFRSIGDPGVSPDYYILKAYGKSNTIALERYTGSGSTTFDSYGATFVQNYEDYLLFGISRLSAREYNFDVFMRDGEIQGSSMYISGETSYAGEFGIYLGASASYIVDNKEVNEMGAVNNWVNVIDNYSKSALVKDVKHQTVFSQVSENLSGVSGFLSGLTNYYYETFVKGPSGAYFHVNGITLAINGVTGTKVNPLISLAPNRWSKVALSTQEGILINDNYITEYNDATGVFAVYGPSIYTKEFKLYELNDILDTTTLNKGSRPSNLINTALPIGYEIKYDGNNVRTYEAGTSNGNYNIGASDYIFNSNFNENNFARVKAAYINSPTNKDTILTGESDLLEDFEIANYNFAQTELLEGAKEKEVYARGLLRDGANYAVDLSIDLPAKLEAEKGDIVTLNVTRLGISANYIIDTHTKDYNPNNNFTSRMTLYESTE